MKVACGEDGVRKRQQQDAFNHLMPLLETVFNMPGSGSYVGSDDWINEMVKKPGSIPYHWAVEYPNMEKALVKYLITMGHKGSKYPLGYPDLRAGKLTRVLVCFHTRTHSRTRKYS